MVKPLDEEEDDPDKFLYCYDSQENEPGAAEDNSLAGLILRLEAFRKGDVVRGDIIAIRKELGYESPVYGSFGGGCPFS